MKFKDGEPCGHRGCLHHVTHPCEGCGRVAGRLPNQGNNSVEAAVRYADSLDWSPKPTIEERLKLAESKLEAVRAAMENTKRNIAVWGDSELIKASLFDEMEKILEDK